MHMDYIAAGWEGIVMSHLIIIIKSEVSVFPIVVIFSAAVFLRWLYHHMLSVSYVYNPGIGGFFIQEQFYDVCK